MFADSFEHYLAQQELKITERVAAYNSGGIDKVNYINEREKVRRKWRRTHPSAHMYPVDIFKASYSNCNMLSKGIGSLSL